MEEREDAQPSFLIGLTTVMQYVVAHKANWVMPFLVSEKKPKSC